MTEKAKKIWDQFKAIQRNDPTGLESEIESWYAQTHGEEPETVSITEDEIIIELDVCEHTLTHDEVKEVVENYSDSFM